MKPLKQVLFEKYGGFADKRIKNLDKSNIFIADDRTPGDVGADRQLLSYFCTIFINTQSSTQPRVELRGNVPTSTAVKSWIKKNGAFVALSFSAPKSYGRIAAALM